MTEKKPTVEIGLIDTNILFYLVDNNEKEKHEKAKEFFAHAFEYSASFAISLQNLREFASVFSKKGKMPNEKIFEVLDNAPKSFFVCRDNEEDIRNGLKLFIEDNVPFWDALLSATMQRHGIKTIYTEDIKDFKKIAGIKAVNPLK